MNKPDQPVLTKACLNCGQQKPLSAFLEMSSTQGSAYGSICSTCRKTALEDAERRKKTEAEGSTTSETGHKIDSKTKVHDAIDKREQIARIDEEYYEERKLDEETTDDINEIKQQANQAQTKHREEYLNKRTFLSGRKVITGPPPIDTQKTKLDKLNRAQRNLENDAILTKEAKEERHKTEHDFTVANQGQQITGQIRFSGQTFQQFRQWLGNSAPIVNNQNQTTKEPTAKESGAITENITKVKTSDPHQNKQTKDPAVEFIENNWRPGSKR